MELVVRQLHRDFNITATSSTGRVLDALSAALNICGERTYEGECAMKLESMAFKGRCELEMPINIKKSSGLNILDTSALLLSALEHKFDGKDVPDIAFSAQRAVARGLAELAIISADQKGVNVIGGSGGVFYNEAISMTIKKEIEDAGYRFIQHKNSCAGDGSVSLGQAVVAALGH